MVPHSAFFIVLIALLPSCNDRPTPVYLINERDRLIELVNAMSLELKELGFAIDTEKVGIEVMSAAKMAAMFNEINDISRPEMEDFLATPNVGLDGKKPLFRDGAKARKAFYDPNSQTIIFREGAINELSKGELAHELSHAYQDQKWGYDKLWQAYKEKPSRELYNLINFALEGHAEFLRQAYEQAHSVDQKALASLARQMSNLYDNECVLCTSNDASQAPYLVGKRFFLREYQEGGWPAVEKHMANLPSSTEAMLHFHKQNDQPTSVSLPAFKPAKFKVERVAEGMMGEAFLLAKLLSIKMPAREAYVAATGWDGDIAHVYKRDDGKEVLLWRIVFDRDQDAMQLERSVSKLGMTKNVMKRGRGVDWIITDDKELLSASRIFMSKNPMRLDEPEQGDMHTTALEEQKFHKGGGLTNYYPSDNIYIKPR